MTAGMAPIERKGLLFVLSSPSGAGKTTLARRLLSADKNIHLSVSVTTRPPRAGEVDGQDYLFLSTDAFERMREAGELLEWASVFGHFYGTPKAPVEQMIEAGRDVLFDIDWQGTQQLADKMPDDVVRVFLLPPSAEVLETRLRDRNLDSNDVVAARMRLAASEISHWTEYDYVIINTDLHVSLDNLQCILKAERLKRPRLRGLASLVRDLNAGL